MEQYPFQGNPELDIIPDDIPACAAVHKRLGSPESVYEYRSKDGLLFVLGHYCSPGQKPETHAWKWNRSEWEPFRPDRPRPLYRLEKLQANPRSPVLVVSDERIADAVQRVLSGTIVTTWCGGLGSCLLADWSPLKGRIVTVWPTCGQIEQDDARAAAARIIEQGSFLEAGKPGVKLIDVNGQPQGWNLADAIQSGWTKHDIVSWGSEHRRSITAPDGPPQQGELIPLEAYTADQQITTSTIQDLWQAAGVGGVNGQAHPNMDNVLRLLEAGGNRFAGIYFDEFLQQVIKPDGEWSEIDDMMTQLWLQREAGFPKVTLGTVNQAINVHAYTHRRNEARTWLSSLEWDMVDRLGSILHRGFGAKPDEYSAAVGRCFLMGMVARVLDPGCKVDNMPVFEGLQGSFKSTALRILAEPYFTEQHEKVTNKDFYLVLRGKMLVEISELSAFKGAEWERVKGVVSNQYDTYRAPYERRAVDHPRQCVFAATTNVDDWNTDDTGARRFWPVSCGTVDLQWLRASRDQLLAEAVCRVKNGESWHDVPKTLAQREQEARNPGDVFDEALEYYLGKMPVVTVRRCITDGLGIEKAEKWDKQLERRVTGVLRRSGYVRITTKIDGVMTRAWKKSIT